MKKHHITLIFVVGLGGMVGATLRFALSLLFETYTILPIGTFLANMIGCFLLTFILSVFALKQKEQTVLATGLTVGCIGSFTTFSTITIEFVELAHIHVLLSISYIAISFIIGLLSCTLGYMLARKYVMTS
ncbi:MAG TPA: CrcB family protein [Bacillota bacterium]|nr:CrcB family protein [Bacillota bacterium]